MNSGTLVPAVPGCCGDRALESTGAACPPSLGDCSVSRVSRGHNWKTVTALHDTKSCTEHKAQQRLQEAAIESRKQGVTRRFCVEGLLQACRAKDDLVLQCVG